MCLSLILAFLYFQFDDFMEKDAEDFIGSSNFMLIEMYYVQPKYQRRNISKDTRCW